MEFGCSSKICLFFSGVISKPLMTSQLWDIIQGKELFRQIYDTQGHYDAKAHLAEMIALLGPPPPELIARSYSLRDFQWPEAVKREDGKICENAEQYFDGPFFDANGNFPHSVYTQLYIFELN